MSQQKSYVKFEHEIAPELRARIGAAESTEDVKKFFVRAVHRFLAEVAGESFQCGLEDIELRQDEPYYRLSESTRASLEEAWKDSDMPAILKRFGELAAHRYAHLEKHKDKTESKMFRH